MNYNSYIKSKDWNDTRRYFKCLGKKSCYICGTKKYLNLHHKHYKTVGYEDGSELVWLCCYHHKELHFKNGKIIPDDDINETRLNSRLESIKRNWIGSWRKRVKAVNLLEKQDNEFYEIVANF